MAPCLGRRPSKENVGRAEAERLHARQYVSGTLQYLVRRRGGRQLVRLQRSSGLQKRAASKTRDVSTQSPTMIMEGFASTERGAC